MPRRWERELLANKSAFAGKLAEGLAHEFNNPITALTSNVTYLQDRFAEWELEPPGADDWEEFSGEAQDVLVAILRIVRRMHNTVSELQALNGLDLAIAAETTHARTLIGDAVAIVHRSMNDPRISLAVKDSPGTVHINRLEVTDSITMLMKYLIAKMKAVEVDNGATHQLVVSSRQDEEDIAIELRAPAVYLSEDDVSRLLDPNLVVGDDQRVKLSVELSVAAGNITRSGGTVGAESCEDGGTLIEVRFSAVQTTGEILSVYAD